MSTKIPLTLGAVLVAALLLSGCTAQNDDVLDAKSASPTPTASSPIPSPSPSPSTPDPSEVGEVDCVNAPTARIVIPEIPDGVTELLGVELVGASADSGPSGRAQGKATLNASGEPESYVVQPGDTLYGIAERFCIEVNSLGTFNRTHGWDLQAGDVIVLRPDPEKGWRWEG